MQTSTLSSTETLYTDGFLYTEEETRIAYDYYKVCFAFSRTLKSPFHFLKNLPVYSLHALEESFTEMYLRKAFRSNTKIWNADIMAIDVETNSYTTPGMSTVP